MKPVSSTEKLSNASLREDGDNSLLVVDLVNMEEEHQLPVTAIWLQTTVIRFANVYRVKSIKSYECNFFMNVKRIRLRIINFILVSMLRPV